MSCASSRKHGNEVNRTQITEKHTYRAGLRGMSFGISLCSFLIALIDTKQYFVGETFTVATFYDLPATCKCHNHYDRFPFSKTMHFSYAMWLLPCASLLLLSAVSTDFNNLRTDAYFATQTSHSWCASV